MKSKFCYLLLLYIVCVMAAIASPAHGQNPSLYARDYEMATVRGDGLPTFAGTPLDEIHVMAYKQGVWTPIPFQIDEKDASGSYFSTDETTGFDDNDEIVFMAFDRGEMVPGAGIWPDDDVSKAFPRGVVNVIDTITERSIGTVYVYRSTTLQKNRTDYISYTPSTTGNAADLITGLTYTLGNEASNGFPNFLAIDPSVGGSGQDLADRFNIHVELTATITIIFPININVTLTEEDFKNATVAGFIDGSIRVLKQVLVDIDVSGVATIDDVSIPIEHTPYSLQLSGTFDLNDLPSEVKSLDRFSLVFDFNDNAIPMTLFTPFNRSGVSVNAQGGEPFDSTPLFIPERYPFHTTGDQGTVLNIFSIPDLGNIRSAFFEDSSSRTGAHGFELEDQIASAIQGANQSSFTQVLLPLGFTGFFLAPNLPNTLGEDLARAMQTPVAADAYSEIFDDGTVPVELVSFQADVNRRDVELTWVTASETGNFGFDVERRPAGSNSWQQVRFVPGMGTTTVAQNYRFTDMNVPPGSYEYRLKQIDTDGSFEYSGVIAVVVGLPETFVLYQNFPNPFNPVTQIQYELPATAGQPAASRRTTLKVYDLLGREIRTVVNKIQQPGFYTVEWDGRDDFGRSVSSGIFLYRLQFGDFTVTRKLALVR